MKFNHCCQIKLSHFGLKPATVLYFINPSLKGRGYESKTLTRWALAHISRTIVKFNIFSLFPASIVSFFATAQTLPKKEKGEGTLETPGKGEIISEQKEIGRKLFVLKNLL